MKFFSWSSSKLTYSSQYSEKGDRISKNSGIFEQALKLTFLGEGKKLHAINSDSLFFSSCVLCMFYYFFFMINWNVIFFKRAGFSFCWNSFRKVSNELRSRTLFTFEFLHFVKRKGKIWELEREMSQRIFELLEKRDWVFKKIIVDSHNKTMYRFLGFWGVCYVLFFKHEEL